MKTHTFTRVLRYMFVSFAFVLMTGTTSVASEAVTFDFGYLKLEDGTNLPTFLKKVAEHEETNKLIPSVKEDLVAIFKQYDYDKNGQLNALEMVVGCMKPLTQEQYVAYKKGKKKKGGGGGDVPPVLEGGCSGTCNCDYIGGGLNIPLETLGPNDVVGTGDPAGGYPGTNQNCVASSDPNCHCHCNTGVCAAGGT